MKPGASKLENGGRRTPDLLDGGGLTALCFGRHSTPARLEGAGAPAHSTTWRWFVRAAILFAAVTAGAQTYKIESSVIAGGGGTSTGGVYSIRGTIGQHDAGRLSGGIYSLEGGFWGMVVTLQSPGAPTLKVTRSGNDVIISWPDPSTGFILQEVTTMSSPPNTISWGNYGGTITVQGGEKTATLTQPTGNRFFRLLKQP